MKFLKVLIAILLFFGIANLPSGYFTFLRIAVFAGGIFIIYKQFENQITFWIISIGIITILFNPIIPVYLYDKSIWTVIDIISGLIFIASAINDYLMDSRNNSDD